MKLSRCVLYDVSCMFFFYINPRKTLVGISVLPHSRNPRLLCMLFRVYFFFYNKYTWAARPMGVYYGRICGVPCPSRERYKAYNIKNMPVPKHVEHMVGGNATGLITYG